LSSSQKSTLVSYCKSDEWILYIFIKMITVSLYFCPPIFASFFQRVCFLHISWFQMFIILLSPIRVRTNCLQSWSINYVFRVTIHCLLTLKGKTYCMESILKSTLRLQYNTGVVGGRGRRLSMEGNLYWWKESHEI